MHPVLCLFACASIVSPPCCTRLMTVLAQYSQLLDGLEAYPLWGCSGRMDCAQCWSSHVAATWRDSSIIFIAAAAGSLLRLSLERAWARSVILECLVAGHGMTLCIA